MLLLVLVGPQPSHRTDSRTAGEDPRGPGHHHHSTGGRPSHHHQHHHPSTGGRDSREHNYRRDPGSHRGPHRDHHGDYSDGKHGPNPQGHHPQELPEKKFLKEEMAKERLLITVARGRTPPLKVRPEEAMEHKGQAGAKAGRGQQETKDSGNVMKPAQDSSSSSSEDNEKDRPAKTKTSKKKKKEKKKKDKKKKKEKEKNWFPGVWLPYVERFFLCSQYIFRSLFL